MKREELLNTLKLASPALLSDSEVVLPILKSFWFNGTHVIASNDVIATCLSVKASEKVIVPGKKLTGFLSACNTKGVKLATSKKGNLIVRCGSSKLSLSSLPDEDWPFEFPDIEQAVSLTVGESFFTAIEMCSSQTPDTGLGSWIGGIILTFGASLGVYGVGRGRSTISHFDVQDLKSKSRKLLPVLRKKTKKISIPSSFCKAALPMSKEFGMSAVLHITEDSVVLDWGDGINVIAGKLINVEMPDVVGKFNEIISEELDFIPITEDLAAALKRSSTIGDEGTCHITFEEAGLLFHTKTKDGASLKDLVDFKESKYTPNVDTKVAADLIVKQLEKCEEIAFGNNTTVMRDKSGDFIYVVANR
jgi:DNA polymerase III sliding clamp (beta) subunit (PCNA family)